MGWPEEQLTAAGQAAAGDMLQCVVCLDVLRDAVSCPTQHGICAECHDSLPSPSSCPQCRTPYQTPPPPLRLARQLVDKLEIHCQHRPLGCLEVLRIEGHDAHAEACTYRPAPCPKGCGTTVPVGRLDRHVVRCGRNVLKDADAYTALLPGADDAPICRGTLLEIVDVLRDEMALHVERVRTEAQAQADARIAAAQAAFTRELAALRQEFGRPAPVATAPQVPSAPPSGPVNPEESDQDTPLEVLLTRLSNLTNPPPGSNSPSLEADAAAAAELQTIVAVSGHAHVMANVSMHSTFPSMNRFGNVWSCDHCEASPPVNTGRLRCTEGCDFDLCSKCALSASATLPVGHAHNVAPVSQAAEHAEMALFGQRWSCDLCGESYRGDDVRLRCTAGCDFDACRACAASAQAEETAVPQALWPECHPEVGDVVARTHGDHHDASDGPLTMSMAGIVIEDDGSTLPIKVHTKGGAEWWYSRKALTVIARPFDLVTAQLIQVATNIPVQRGPDW